MKLEIDFTQPTLAGTQEENSISILCTSKDDGLQYFADHYPRCIITASEVAS